MAMGKVGKQGIRKSFLKWAGGKGDSVRLINDVVGDIRGRLIEPFVGSAVVSLNVEAKGYILGDFNEDLIRLFSFIKNEKSAFVDYCQSFFSKDYNTEEKYYELREIFNKTSDMVERAALFVYLNRHSFNGLCRYNSSGYYNVPFGSYKNVGFPKKEMHFFIMKAESCVFYHQDFEQTIALAERGDVIYSDPPYVPLSDTAFFTDYTSCGFGMDEQKRLVRLAESSKCKFLISNVDTEVTRKLYENADDIQTRFVGRYIAANKDSRSEVKELLAIYNG